MNMKHNAQLRRSEPDRIANLSILGEEDPGAALDSTTTAQPEDFASGPHSADFGVCQTSGTPKGSSDLDMADRAELLRRAISRWDNEGGADGTQAFEHSRQGDGRTDVLLTNAELVQLQIRVIALENLVTALLAGAPDQTSVLARELARSICPRPGFTPHHLTIQAAAQMVHMVERSGLFRSEPAVARL